MIDVDNERNICLMLLVRREIKHIFRLFGIFLVPPRLAPIPPIKINLDENSPPQRAVFTCRVLRGSAESLSLEWILTDGTPVQVRFTLETCNGGPAVWFTFLLLTIRARRVHDFWIRTRVFSDTPNIFKKFF
jgi:hypothetical protein